MRPDQDRWLVVAEKGRIRLTSIDYDRDSAAVLGDMVQMRILADDTKDVGPGGFGKAPDFIGRFLWKCHTVVLFDDGGLEPHERPDYGADSRAELRGPVHGQHPEECDQAPEQGEIYPPEKSPQKLMSTGDLPQWVANNELSQINVRSSWVLVGRQHHSGLLSSNTDRVDAARSVIRNGWPVRIDPVSVSSAKYPSAA
jgi:hypothetical protein